ncbi:MAG: pitrilysin family protein [Chitinophagales bacterium]
MIEFERFTLDNGLRVIVHPDKTTPMAAVNMLYNVGARNELEDKTGFAHLFEHLMFAGSKHVSDFDVALQMAGGVSNAFTNNDVTNYYDILPANNLDRALWLESDRLMHLNINSRSLEVQRKVVIEEFKENYLNQPYGDIWHLLSKLAYKVHPYKWPTIGKELSHIEHATLDDVQQFFAAHYRPDNAILVLAGDIDLEMAKSRVFHWFGDIPAGKMQKKNIPAEPIQTEARLLEAEANVPLNAIYKAWHMGPRDSQNYYVMDLITDLLSEGDSSRFYSALVKESKAFVSADAYISGSFDNGLVIVEGKLAPGVSMKMADELLTDQIELLREKIVEARELEKVKNKIEAYYAFSEINLLNRATNLAFSELLGDADLINHEMNAYLKIDAAELQKEAQQVFSPENCSTIYYYSKK